MNRVVLIGVLAAAVALSFGCANAAPDAQVQTVNATSTPPEGYVTTRVNNLELTLRNDNGRCVLSYANLRPYADRLWPERPSGNTVLLDMEAPCNLIRLPGRPDTPHIYEPSRSDKSQRKILLIVGGKPDPEVPLTRDQFMPDGCGSLMQKLTVFSDSITVEFPATRNGNCPSFGMDEVFFAA